MGEDQIEDVQQKPRSSNKCQFKKSIESVKENRFSPFKDKHEKYTEQNKPLKTPHFLLFTCFISFVIVF